MSKLIDYLSTSLKIENKVLLEKDIFLHELLIRLLQEDYFNENLVFKGGTCLIKCYLRYYRFSEDIDFSWTAQEEFKNKSQKEIRRLLSGKISSLCLILEKIAASMRLDFKGIKSNPKYIELGGSNKFTTFKLWYKSTVLGREQFIKIQINFLEEFEYPFKVNKAHSILKGINEEEFKFLFPEHELLLSVPQVKCYSLKEILIEKVRAILTRKGIKSRDFVDIYLILKHEKVKLAEVQEQIIKKTKFMMRYDKYIQNLKDFKLEKFVLGDEEKLMLIPLDKGFEEFLKEIHQFLSDIIKRI